VHLSRGRQQHADGICVCNVNRSVSWFGDCDSCSNARAALWRIRPGLDFMKTSASTLPIGRWLGYAVLILFAVISLGPLWIAFKTALTGPNSLFASGASLLPQDTTL